MSNREAISDMFSKYSNVKADSLKIYQVMYVPANHEDRHSITYTINVAAKTIEEALLKAQERVKSKWSLFLVSVELLATETNPPLFD